MRFDWKSENKGGVWGPSTDILLALHRTTDAIMVTMPCHMVKSQSNNVTWRWIDYEEKVCRSPHIHASEWSGVVRLIVKCKANHHPKAKRCILLFLWRCDWRRGLVCALDIARCAGVGLPTLAHLRSRSGSCGGFWALIDRTWCIALT